MRPRSLRGGGSGWVRRHLGVSVGLCGGAEKLAC